MSDSVFKMEDSPESSSMLSKAESEQNEKTSDQRQEQSESSNYAHERSEKSVHAADSVGRHEKPATAEVEGAHIGGSVLTHMSLLRDNGLNIKQLEEWERHADSGAMFLKKLMSAFEPMADSHPEVRKFIEDSIALLEKKARPEINIGVYEATGAGKSKLFNMLLNQDILHTNSMQAGTQTVTIVSYNDNNDPAARFRADVETINLQEWKAELRILFEDIKGFTPEQLEEQGATTEAGSARDKLKAVYPDIDLEDTAKLSLELLCSKASKTGMFSTTHSFKATSSRQLNKALEQWLTSSNDRQGRQKPAYWPLVRECRLYVKDPLLKCGINLVDLPGCGDSNVARAMRAEAYRQKVHVVFVAALITRAVDDQTAQDLLGKNFRRQAQLDGLLDGKRLTFIMTKADDINVAEVMSQLRMKQRTDVKTLIKEQKEDRAMMKSSEDAIMKLEIELDQLSGPYKKVSEEIKKLRAKIKENNSQAEGNQKTSSALAVKKGKESAVPSSRRKQKKKTESSLPGKQSKKPEKSAGTRQISDPMLSPAEKKMKSLMAQRDNVNRQKRKLKKAIQFQLDNIADFKVRIAKYDDNLRRLCIKERNTYLTKVFQQRWSQDIREMQYDLAGDKYEDPMIDVSALAEKIPVFCVSAKAFEQLSGRNKREALISGFDTFEDTGIPQLRRHCQESSIPARYANVEVFLRDLDILANRMAAWADDDSPEIRISSQQAEMIEGIWNDLCSKFKEHHIQAIDRTVTNVYSHINKHIPGVLQKAADRASEDLPTVTDALFNSKSKSNIHIFSFRAACRKHGEEHKTGGGLIIKLNERFAESFINIIAPSWDKVFNRSIPPLSETHHKVFVEGWGALRTSFITHVSNMNPDAAKRYDNILPQSEHMTRRVSTEFKETFDAFNMSTRSINRLPKRIVKSGMAPVYGFTIEEKGTGMQERIRQAVKQHVATNGKLIFEDARKTMVAEISGLRQDLARDMEDIHDVEMKKVCRDVKHVLKIGKAACGSKLVRPDKQKLQKLIVTHVLDLGKAWNGVPIEELIFGDMAGPSDEPLKDGDDVSSDEEALPKNEKGTAGFTNEQIRERLGLKGNRRYESDDSENDAEDAFNLEMSDLEDADVSGDEGDDDLDEDEDMQDDSDEESEEED